MKQPGNVQGYSQVSWRVKSEKTGKHVLMVEASNGAVTEQEVQITQSSLFE